MQPVALMELPGPSTLLITKIPIVVDDSLKLDVSHTPFQIKSISMGKDLQLCFDGLLLFLSKTCSRA